MRKVMNTFSQKCKCLNINGTVAVETLVNVKFGWNCLNSI